MIYQSTRTQQKKKKEKSRSAPEARGIIGFSVFGYCWARRRKIVLKGKEIADGRVYRILDRRVTEKAQPQVKTNICPGTREGERRRLGVRR